MRHHYFLISAFTVVILGVGGGFLALLYGNRPSFSRRTATAPAQVPAHATGWQPVFSPPAPQDAPAEWRDLVLRGQKILLDSKANAAAFVGKSNQLACRNCHFDAGRRQDTISLVGVAAKYPWAAPNGKPQTLAQKVQECFVTELAGTAPPLDSPEMQSVLAYLSWISRGVPMQSQPEWLGLTPLDLGRDPHVQSGMGRFSDICTPCHGSDGQGNVIAPPVWGSGSFTATASMAQQTVLAAFIYDFMPYGNPHLPKAVAFDVAGFLRSRSRPGAKQAPPVALGH